MSNTFTQECSLCQQNFSFRNKLLIHKRNKHWNNKVIFHHASFTLSSFEHIVYYQDAFIVLIKKQLGFNRHSVGSKRLSISVFPENVFVHLFQNEPSFRYNSALRKYYCTFKGEAGEGRLKQILNYMNTGIADKIPKQKQRDMYNL